MIENKFKLNLRGQGITHRSNGHTGLASTHGKVPEYVEWTDSDESDCTVYIDYNMQDAWFDFSSNRKFGWLIESKYITPDIVEHVKQNKDAYFNTFESIFTHNKDLLELDDRFKFTPATGYWVKESQLHQKSKLVSMISSNKTMCDGHKYRLSWVEKLKGSVDLYGRGFNEIENKEDGLQDYMFSVAIENGSYKTYFTEKLLDCFAAATIPVYHGAPDIGDYFNTDGMIILDDSFSIDQLSRDLYESKLDAVKDNMERIKEMEIPEDWFYRRYIK